MFESLLTDYEKERRDWALKVQGYDVMIDIEEDCCGSRSYHYEVWPSGIGDGIYLVYRGEKTLLSDPDSF